MGRFQDYRILMVLIVLLAGALVGPAVAVLLSPPGPDIETLPSQSPTVPPRLTPSASQAPLGGSAAPTQAATLATATANPVAQATSPLTPVRQPFATGILDGVVTLAPPVTNAANVAVTETATDALAP